MNTTKKVLFVCTYGDFLTSFELSNISIYQEMGYQVHCASNFAVSERNKKNHELKSINCILHNIEFERKPSFKSFKLIKKIKKIILENNISVIDTHNAVCSALVRIAAKKLNVKIVYTPHSFFFYDGCPLKYKLIYKPIEFYLAKFTDLLILINKEDYEASKKMNIRGKSIYVPGIGIDAKKIMLSKKDEYFRKELNIKKDEVLLLSVGELNLNKNHESVLRALSTIENNNFKYVICGMGELDNYLEQLIKELNMEEKVIMAGFRTDIYSILHEIDAFIFPSFREGLSAALMEAMACGKFCICSKIRGNVDLITKDNGMLFDPNNIDEIKECLTNFLKNYKYYKKVGVKNIELIKRCDLNNVRQIMINEYRELLK